MVSDNNYQYHYQFGPPAVSFVGYEIMNATKIHLVFSIRIGGNMFHEAEDSPPWAFPLDNVPVEHNTSRPPTTQANAIENFVPHAVRKHKKKRMGPGGIAFMVGAGTLLATGFALLIAIRLNKFHTERLEESFESNHRSFRSPPISAAKGNNSLHVSVSYMSGFHFIY